MGNIISPTTGQPLTPEPTEITGQQILEIIATRMPAPVAEDMEKGKEFYDYCRLHGFNLKRANVLSIWASLYGMFGAVERLQDRVTRLQEQIRFLAKGQGKNLPKSKPKK